MTKKRICFIVILLLMLFLLIFSLNFYFLSRLNEQIQLKAAIKHNNDKNYDIKTEIRRRTKYLKPAYFNRNPKYYIVRNKLLENFKPVSYENVSLVWNTANWWPKLNEVYPQYDITMGEVIYALQNENILKARNSPRGTQLKLLLNLTGGQSVIFKPQWYDRNVIINGPVYSGKDRHTAEIFAFYLGAVLNFRWTPIAVGRRVNLKEIYDKADKELKETIEIIGNGSQYCVYGKCFYCKKSEVVCGNTTHEIEGVMLYVIPGSIAKQRSPWQRTYKNNVKAQWEEDNNYCEQVKTKFTSGSARLLDLIDISIFDFLIQNGDRHHYETRNERILLLDNGKGFGNSEVDFIDILAPLYQCCELRDSTWQRLLMLSGGNLSKTIKDLTKNDQLYPILIDEHFDAVERRLLLIFSTIEICREKYGNSIFK